MAEELKKHEPQALQIVLESDTNRELVRRYSRLTPEKIIGGSYPSLATLRKENGIEPLEDALGILIVEVSSYFGEGFNESQSLNIATEILSNYYYLSIEDCIFVLNRLKRKTIFGKLTPNVVLAMFDSYDTERTKLVNDNNYSKHLSQKENRMTPTKTDDILRIIKQSNKK